MLCQIYDVRVHADTSRFFQVPAHDLPIIQLLWKRIIAAKATLGQRIEVHATGSVQPRSLYDERQRLAREYAVVPDGHDKPAFAVIYPTDADLDAAYAASVAEGTAIHEAIQQAQAKPAKKTVKASSTSETADELRARLRAEVRAELEAEAAAAKTRDRSREHHPHDAPPAPPRAVATRPATPAKKPATAKPARAKG